MEQFGNYCYIYNFPENKITFTEVFNKIGEICESFMILKNLLQKFSWFKKSFDGLAYCIE